MYSFRKSKKGFTLIELMVVVAIIGVLALLGLRLYIGQQEKAKNAIVKANAGTIQTLIQAELADSTPALVYADLDNIVDDAGIHNPFLGAPQVLANEETGTPYTDQSDSTETAIEGDVWVMYDSSDYVFYVNGWGGQSIIVYDTNLSARK